MCTLVTHIFTPNKHTHVRAHNTHTHAHMVYRNQERHVRHAYALALVHCNQLFYTRDACWCVCVQFQNTRRQSGSERLGGQRVKRLHPGELIRCAFPSLCVNLFCFVRGRSECPPARNATCLKCACDKVISPHAHIHLNNVGAHARARGVGQIWPAR